MSIGVVGDVDDEVEVVEGGGDVSIDSAVVVDGCVGTSPSRSVAIVWNISFLLNKSSVVL